MIYFKKSVLALSACERVLFLDIFNSDRVKLACSMNRVI